MYFLDTIHVYIAMTQIFVVCEIVISFGSITMIIMILHPDKIKLHFDEDHEAAVGVKFNGLTSH